MVRMVGVVGLGIMGGAMARNLVQAGWTVAGCDPNPERCQEAAAAGVVIVADIAELARAAPTLLTSLPSAAALVTTAEALVAAAVPPRVIVEASTLAIEDKQQAERLLAAAGHVMLDCPISGTGAQAARRDIVLYASGDTRAIAALRPMFAAFARDTHDLGAFGNGSRMKFVANLLVAIHNVASAEAMVLGMKAGLDPHMLVDLVNAGVGTSRVFALRAPMMADNDYSAATMKMDVWQKDMAVIGAFANSLDCPTPLLNATAALYVAALAQGHGEHDTAAVCAVLESMAGLRRDGARHHEG
jgi:putative dehydrogenase